MARGQQKIQAQQKNAQRKEAQRKKESQKGSAAKALTVVCSVCRTQMPDNKTYKQHFESKHSKLPLPEDLKQI